jgi:hypothetical protein
MRSRTQARCRPQAEGMGLEQTPGSALDRGGEARAEANLELLPGRDEVPPDRKRIPEAPGGMS